MRGELVGASLQFLKEPFDGVPISMCDMLKSES